MSYETFSNDLSERLIATSDNMAQGQSVKAFSNGKKDLDELFKIFDRQTELGAMRSLKGKTHTAGEWVSPKSKVEIMAGCERDVRARYHRRLNAYLGGIDQPHLTKFALQLHAADMKAISQTS